MMIMKEKQLRRTMYVGAKMNEMKELENQMQQRTFLKHQMFNLSESHDRTSLYNWYPGGIQLHLAKLAPDLVSVMGAFLPG